MGEQENDENENAGDAQSERQISTELKKDIAHRDSEDSGRESRLK